MIENFAQAQNRLHALLANFINGIYYDSRSQRLYPWRQRLNFSAYHQDLSALAQYWGLDFDLTRGNTGAGLAGMIAEFYGHLREEIPARTTLDRIQVEITRSYDENSYTKDPGARNIHRLVHYLRSNHLDQYTDLFLLHGSYSSMDYVEGISDLDALILIKDEVMRDTRKLIELHHLCYRSMFFFFQIDHLQHHGYFVLTAADLAHYPQTYFPVVLFEQATRVFGADRVTLTLRDSTAEKEQAYRNTLDHLKNVSPAQLRDLYSYKLYFQVLQLLPIAWLQLQGRHVYKKESFEEFTRVFPQSERLFSRCWELRHDWRVNPINFPLLLRLLFKIMPNPNLLPVLNRRVRGKVHPYMYERIGEKVHRDEILPLIRDLEASDHGIH